ncbi:MAG: SMC-Scp complex subunit ScpB [Candidatus Hodarchaeales archaeon]
MSSSGDNKGIIDILDELRLIEALLYVMNRPVSLTEIAEVIQKNDDEVIPLLDQLQESYTKNRRPYEIVKEEDHYLLKLKQSIVEKIKLTDLVKTGEIPKHLIGLAAYIAFQEYVKKEKLTVAILVKKKGKAVREKINELEKNGLILTEPSGKTRAIKISKNFLTMFNLPADNPEEIGEFLKAKIYEYAEKMFSGG